MIQKKGFYSIQEHFFNLFILLSWILLVLSAIGFQGTPSFLKHMDYYVRIYICLFLMWRFNPFRTHYEFKDLDRKVAFSAGLFILTTTALNKYLVEAENAVKHLL
jgi:hypothetical protein